MTVFFFIKKLISQFLYPLPCALILLTLGLVLLFCTQHHKLGKALNLIGVCLLLVFSYKPTVLTFLSHLERQSRPLLTGTSANAPENLPEAAWILVLASGHTTDASLPATSQLSLQSLARLVEAIRLHRLLPKSKLLLSGGTVVNGRANGKVIAAAAQELGVSKEAIVVGPLAPDTPQEAAQLHHILDDSPFILVTSALHMQRAVALFSKRGMRPIPSPAAYVTKGSDAANERLAPGNFFPQANLLHASTRGVHEYIGLLWAKLRGLI